MANGRNRAGSIAKARRVSPEDRDAGGFIALPWQVVDSAAYQRLSHAARSLLIEIDRQYVLDNNGRLLASIRYMRSRGWKSSDTLSRAKKELLDAGLIYETFKGHFPNKASWYAVTWRRLDRIPGYDAGAEHGFRRGAYRENTPLCPSGGLR